MMDGQSWTGDWAPSTFYKIGELVKVGGLIYKCIEGHISNADANNGVLGDELKWVYFARGEDYQSVWQPNTLYNVDQTVIYGGSIWKCNTAHTSASADDGLQFNAAYWDPLSQDQTTLEATGHQTLCTIQTTLCTMVVQFIDVRQDTDLHNQINL